MAILPDVFDAMAHAAMSNFDLAIDLASQGVAIFPCRPDNGPLDANGVPEWKEKTPYPGILWRSASTTNETRIRQWWSLYPDAIPAIDLGKIDAVVIDCDRKPGAPDGVSAFNELATRHGDALEQVPIVETITSGLHHYYRQWGRHGNGRGNLPAGVDVRGAGGYVIAPGATMLDGRRYEPLQGHFLSAPDAPPWLVEVLNTERSKPTAQFTVEAGPPVSDERKRQYGHAALAEEMRYLAAAGPGTRNESANIAAFKIGRLVGGGCLTFSEAYASLANAAMSWGIPANDKALGPKGTIARGLRDGMSDPREPPPDGPVITLARKIVQSEDGTLADAETGEVIDQTPAPDGELPDHLTRVPGLVGRITDWITDCALFPQRGLALGAALCVVGTAAGRHLAGPTKNGTHLYVVGLAPSGAGKDHALSQIAVILAAADMRSHIGPSQFISMPAVINFLCRAPLSICAMDEFGAFLKRINNRRASGFEGAISGLLRTAWGSSFKAMPTPEWAGRASETIFSPAMSIYGASTAKEFYDSLEGGDVTNGVLNRFLIIETKKRPRERAPLCDSNAVPADIVRGLQSIYLRKAEIAGQLCQSNNFPAFDKIGISAEAEALRRALIDDLRQRGDEDPSLEPFLARTAENALRLATIVAIGAQGPRAVIDEATMAWAVEFASWSTAALAKGAGLYIADSETQAAANAVKRAIQEKGGRIVRRGLIRALKHRYKTRELEDVIKSLVEAGEIALEKAEQSAGGHPLVWYSIAQD